RVLIAIGGRGTPRRLPFDLGPDVEAKVHYSLADARSFEGQRVVIVGLGDVAMETALALSRQPGTEVSIVYRGDAFRRGKTRNIEEIRRAIQAGRIALRWRSEVVAVRPNDVTLSEGGRTVVLPNDAVFVMIGSIAPWSMLRAFGIRSAADPTVA